MTLDLWPDLVASCRMYNLLSVLCLRLLLLSVRRCVGVAVALDVRVSGSEVSPPSKQFSASRATSDKYIVGGYNST